MYGAQELKKKKCGKLFCTIHLNLIFYLHFYVQALKNEMNLCVFEFKFLFMFELSKSEKLNVENLSTQSPSKSLNVHVQTETKSLSISHVKVRKSM